MNPRSWHWSFGTLLGLLASFGIADAQAQSPYSTAYEPVQGHIMGGYSATSGTTSDYLQDGWMFDGGVTFWPHSGPLGIRGDLSFSDHYTADQLLAQNYQPSGGGYVHGWGYLGAVSGGLVLRSAPSGYARVYGLAQAGVTRVDLRVRQSYYGSGYYCGPFSYYCGYASGGGLTVYDYSANKFSWNVGVGVEFPTSWGSSWFLEAQYRRIQTPQPFEYWPVAVGLRF